MTQLLILIYWLAIAALSVYGLLGFYTLCQYWRHRHQSASCPPLPDNPPSVTIQLPIYNEQFVVARLIDTAVQIEYPPEKLQIQIVDDSTDATKTQAARLATYYKRKGFNVSHIHRIERTGFKAGALENALQTATGEFIAIFDADFQPQPDFLQQTIPHFLQDKKLGMIQTRWGHLNHDESALTAAQAIAIDKHFAMEQLVRHRANLFPKFNGTGGVWRRECLDSTGGWHEDTVCEDLCLSTRALLDGWQFRFLNDVVAPAELPASISAYKNQQARWAKGSLQCLLKFAKPIVTATNQSWMARIYALLAMSAYLTHVFMLIILLLQIPLILLDYQVSAWIYLFTLAGLGQPLLFIWGQQILYRDWLKRLRHFPTLLLLAIGMAPTNARAIFQAFYGRQHPFIRTPKQGNQRNKFHYHLPFDHIVLIEIMLAAYTLIAILFAIRHQNYGPIFFLTTCSLGLGYVISLTLHEQLKNQFALRKAQIAPHSTHQ